VDEAKKIKDEDTDVGLTTAVLASAGAVREERAAAAPSFGVSRGSSAGAATAVALDKQVVPLFSADEAKDFRGRWRRSKLSLLTSRGRWWSRPILLLPWQ